jgi:hypothetical protein
MRRKFIGLWIGMGVVPGRQHRHVLGVVRELGHMVVLGMMLVQFDMSDLVRAGSSLWSLGVIRLAIRSWSR